MADPLAQDDLWATYAADLADRPETPFAEQLTRFHDIYRGRRPEEGPPLVWRPDPDRTDGSNLGRFMAEEGFSSYDDLQAWSARDRAAFWGSAALEVGFPFRKPARTVLDLTDGPENPRWFPGAAVNAALACFQADPDEIAVVAGSEGSEDLVTTTYGELLDLTRRVAAGFDDLGLPPGTGVALLLPLTAECVATYLGAVWAGLSVVSIAESFSAAEIRRRLEIARPEALVTVDRALRKGRTLELYARAREAGAPPTIVLPGIEPGGSTVRPGDLLWQDFLPASSSLPAAVGDPERTTNILFSSGTTATPKAIPWTHLTPLKCIVDGHFHQDVQPGDVVTWPTSIGWMMGPWLIYAALGNRATIALYDGSPGGPGFCRFVERAGVSVLGLVPSLVRAWRAAAATDGCDWSRVRLFSSTGEPSSREDYLWLMSRTAYRAPVIEYCGGTEIGGGFLTGTVVQPASPTLFTSPALGIDIAVLDDEGRPVARGSSGELFLLPPSVGLSERLLGGDHHAEYYAGCPAGPRGAVLRRHGDRVTPLPGGYFRAEGRADDAMNLGGIKVAALELERTLESHPDVDEAAAVAVRPEEGGGDRLVVFAVPRREVEAAELRGELQARLEGQLNPLFRIHDVVLLAELPRTASAKLLRRSLRARYRRATAEPRPDR